jgi:hypothetical protein
MKIGVWVNWKDPSWETDTGEPIDGVDLENSEFLVNIDRFENLYSVTAQSHDYAKFYVVDNETEALQLFKTELGYCVYEIGFDSSNNEEKEEAERTLKNHGFLEDMKNAYQIIQKFDGPIPVDFIRSSNFEEVLQKKNLDLSSELISIAAIALYEKGYLKMDLSEDRLVYSIAKPLDF